MGLAGQTVAELDMPVLNYFDETYTINITIDETPTAMAAIIDTAMSDSVIETTTCTDCAAGTIDTASGAGGLSVTATAASGSINNPESTYEGFEGTATLCIYADGDYSTPPTSVNIATMPCIQNANLHFADTVATPNADAVAYLGMALGNGADSDGNTPDSTDLIMNQFETAGKIDAASKVFGIGILADNGIG